jgi:DNA polymerase elongation subunit (family B)
MAKFSWWKRGVKVTTPIKKVPKGSSEPLVWHQIQHGDFRPSPYLEMAKIEFEMWKNEIEKYKSKNPRVSEDSIRDFSNLRWRTYHKRIEKLKGDHIQYESSRLKMLKDGLISAFGMDIWEKVIEKCEGDETNLYNLYKKETMKIKGENLK